MTMERSAMSAPDLTRARWRKSIRSNNSQACVEIAHLGDGRAVRDSKDPDGPRLYFTRKEWAAFVMEVRGGLQPVGQEP
jgi:hypothetical protein